MTEHHPLEEEALKVLVIDSKSSSLANVVSLLQECSYKVVGVKTGKEALKLLGDQMEGTSSGFDLIMKDHSPPNSCCFRLLREVLQREKLRKIPVIVMSSQDERDVVMKCLHLGAADYLIKPLRHNELRNLWTRVWWRKMAQSVHPNAVLLSPGAKIGPHFAELSDTSYDSDWTKDEEDTSQPTSKEGSARGGDGSGNGSGSGTGSKEGTNGSSRNQVKTSNAGSNGNGNSATKNGHGSNNVNGDSTTKIGSTGNAFTALRARNEHMGSFNPQLADGGAYVSGDGLPCNQGSGAVLSFDHLKKDGVSVDMEVAKQGEISSEGDGEGDGEGANGSNDNGGSNGNGSNGNIGSSGQGSGNGNGTVNQNGASTTQPQTQKAKEALMGTAEGGKRKSPEADEHEFKAPSSAAQTGFRVWSQPSRDSNKRVALEAGQSPPHVATRAAVATPKHGAAGAESSLDVRTGQPSSVDPSNYSSAGVVGASGTGNKAGSGGSGTGASEDTTHVLPLQQQTSAGATAKAAAGASAAPAQQSSQHVQVVHPQAQRPMNGAGMYGPGTVGNPYMPYGAAQAHQQMMQSMNPMAYWGQNPSAPGSAQQSGQEGPDSMQHSLQAQQSMQAQQAQLQHNMQSLQASMQQQQKSAAAAQLQNMQHSSMQHSMAANQAQQMQNLRDMSQQMSVQNMQQQQMQQNLQQALFQYGQQQQQLMSQGGCASKSVASPHAPPSEQQQQAQAQQPQQLDSRQLEQLSAALMYQQAAAYGAPPGYLYPYGLPLPGMASQGSFGSWRPPQAPGAWQQQVNSHNGNGNGHLNSQPRADTQAQSGRQSTPGSVHHQVHGDANGLNKRQHSVATGVGSAPHAVNGLHGSGMHGGNSSVPEATGSKQTGAMGETGGGDANGGGGPEPSCKERRIAALNKFKQKRKNLCFTKKIRYESRKQLAQQRPRVKGQFVRLKASDVPDHDLAEAMDASDAVGGSAAMCPAPGAPGGRPSPLDQVRHSLVNGLGPAPGSGLQLAPGLLQLIDAQAGAAGKANGVHSKRGADDGAGKDEPMDESVGEDERYEGEEGDDGDELDGDEVAQAAGYREQARAAEDAAEEANVVNSPGLGALPPGAHAAHAHAHNTVHALSSHGTHQVPGVSHHAAAAAPHGKQHYGAASLHGLRSHGANNDATAANSNSHGAPPHSYSAGHGHQVTAAGQAGSGHMEGRRGDGQPSVVFQRTGHNGSDSGSNSPDRDAGSGPDDGSHSPDREGSGL